MMRTTTTTGITIANTGTDEASVGSEPIQLTPSNEEQPANIDLHYTVDVHASVIYLTHHLAHVRQCGCATEPRVHSPTISTKFDTIMTIIVVYRKPSGPVSVCWRAGSTDPPINMVIHNPLANFYTEVLIKSTELKHKDYDMVVCGTTPVIPPTSASMCWVGGIAPS